MTDNYIVAWLLEPVWRASTYENEFKKKSVIEIS